VRLVRPGARLLGPVRLGAGREHAMRAARAADPVSLGTLPDGRPLELVGATHALLAPTGIELEEPLRLDLSAHKTSERRQVALLRLALHLFVDHAALALVPAAVSRVRRGLVVSRAGAAEIALGPVRPELARRWLAGLAKEIVQGPDGAFMPVESVLRVAHLFAGGSPTLERDLLRSIEAVRGPKWEGGQSRWGPVRDVVRLPPPAAPARLAGQRFSFFFHHLHRPAITAPSKEAR
jgi:hypothetical protein